MLFILIGTSSEFNLTCIHLFLWVYRGGI